MSTGMDGNKPASPTVGSFGHQRRPSPHRGMNTYGDREDSLRDSYYGETSSTPGMGSIASSLSSKEEGNWIFIRPLIIQLVEMFTWVFRSYPYRPAEE